MTPPPAPDLSGEARFTLAERVANSLDRHVRAFQVEHAATLHAIDIAVGLTAVVGVIVMFLALTPLLGEIVWARRGTVPTELPWVTHPVPEPVAPSPVEAGEADEADDDEQAAA